MNTIYKLTTHIHKLLRSKNTTDYVKERVSLGVDGEQDIA